MDLKKESKAEIILWNWLKTKGISVKRIYFNKKTNIVLSPSFQTEGLHKKPDLLIKTDVGFGNKYIAIEVKTSDHDKEIYDGGKIMDYYKNYVFEKTKYIIDNQKILISCFILATENSPKGYLFKNENKTFDNSKRVEYQKYSSCPQYEFEKTKGYLRNLWAGFRRFRNSEEGKNMKLKPSLGILISNPRKDNLPYLQIMGITNKWRQRFWRI